MEKLIKLFGYSFHSKELTEIIEALDINYPDKPFMSYKGDIMSADASNPAKSIYLGFEGANYAYPACYGKPKVICGNKDEELILMEVTISSNSIEGVLGLRIGDSQEDVVKKINSKPKKKSISEPGSMPGSVRRHNWIFYLDDYKLQVSFKDDLKVDFIRVREFDKSEKLKRTLKATIKEQKKNISPKNVKNVELAGDTSFLHNWNIEKKHDLKKNELIEILKNYLTSITENTIINSPSKIYSETSKLVKTINNLNKDSDFIETNEREDLCAFIEKVVQSTGFIIPEGLDITEEYRMW